MRKPTFDQSDVIAAAIELQKQNKKVTGHALAKTLGGGRPDRFERIWQEHLLTKEEQPSTESEDYLSPALEETFDQLTKNLVSDLKYIFITCEKHLDKQANSRIEKEQMRSAEAVSEVKEQLIDANAVINKQEDKIEVLLSEQQSFESEKKAISELETQLEVLKTKNESYAESLKDKDRIIAEQDAQIRAFAHFDSLLSQKADLAGSTN